MSDHILFDFVQHERGIESPDARSKRAFDAVVASCLLVLVAPLVMVLWVFVRLDGAPGFYGQTRIGRAGAPFTCWKLRSMVPDAEAVLREMCSRDPALAREWADNQKLRDDPRITRIGGLMRKTSLDELPQLWNVVRGEMSLVGPRPFMAEQLAEYMRVPGSEAYFRLRPGVTGPWQVSGRGCSTFVERVSFDSEYSSKRSMRLDLLILWQTVFAVARCDGH